MDIRLLNEIPQKRTGIDVFYGYNHNVRIGEGEFYEMLNMTSDSFPVLSPRGARGEFVYPLQGIDHKINGMISKDELCYVDETNLYIGNTLIENFQLEDSPKQIVSMGAYIVIFPDKKYINTKDYSDKGSIEVEYISSGDVSYEICRPDGRVYTKITISDSEPDDAANMDVWLDTSVSPGALKQYSESQGEWVSIATTYVKISAKGIAQKLDVYDGVTISGIEANVNHLQEINGKASLIQDIYKTEDGNGDYIVVAGTLDRPSYQQTTPITVERKMPILDFVIESQNRLWGCRYGKNIDGETVNEIYASKLGDFKNWNSFAGISTDSYVASCGTDGQWTGAVNFSGHPTFFKERCLHKVYGNYPSAYQIQDIDCRGVQLGCANSLAVVNETLYYKSRSGICMYDGALPIEISQALGDIKYTGVDSTDDDILRNGAVAGSIGNKYYISMRSEIDGKWNLFVYDTTKQIWHREDNTKALQFCDHLGELYYIDAEDMTIKTVMGSGLIDPSKVEWGVESGIIGLEMANKKYVSRLIIRLMLEIGTKVDFFAHYDSIGEWKNICSLTGTTLQSFSVPIKTQRCDHFRLRIKGTGNAKILSIVKVIEQGGDK